MKGGATGSRCDAQISRTSQASKIRAVGLSGTSSARSPR